MDRITHLEIAVLHTISAVNRLVEVIEIPDEKRQQILKRLYAAAEALEKSPVAGD